MTVAAASTETRYVLAGDNLGPFATVWPYEDAADVVATLYTAAGYQVLGAGGDYTLVGATPLDNGGQVTLSGTILPAGGWAADSFLMLSRATGEDQPSAFGEMDSFSPEASEDAIDHVERQAQDLATKLGRAILLAPGDNGDFTLPPSVVRVDQFLTFDDAGAPIVTDLPLRANRGNLFLVFDGAGDVTVSTGEQLLAMLADLLPVPRYPDGEHQTILPAVADRKGRVAVFDDPSGALDAGPPLVSLQKPVANYPDGEASTTLPALADRKGRILVFDAVTGAITDGVAASTIVSADQPVATEAWVEANFDVAGAAAAAQVNAEMHADAAAATAQADAVATAEAYTDAQIAALPKPMQATLQQITGAGGGSLSPSISFTPSGPGILVAIGSRNNSDPDPGADGTSPVTLSLTGAVDVVDNTKLTTCHVQVTATAGGASVTATYSATAAVQFSAQVTLVYIPNT